MSTVPVVAKKQPKVFYLSFFVGMAERYGYYILTFLLTLYVKNVYGLSDVDAFAVYAVFGALSYITPAIGGYLSDNVIGIKRCLLLGLLCETVGFILLALPIFSFVIFNIGLSCVTIGAGLFKAAPTNVLGRAYEEGDPRIDSGFTLYYMAINIGVLFSSLVAGVGQKQFGWHIPFLFAALGLILGIVWFFGFKHYITDNLESKAGHKPFKFTKWVATIVGLAVATAVFAYFLANTSLAYKLIYLLTFALGVYFVYQIIISPKLEKLQIIVVIILILLAIIFFALYCQAFTSMMLFINRNVDRTVFGVHIPTASFIGLNGFWIIVLSPILAVIYKKLAVRGKDLAITTKFPMGILIIAFAFFLLKLATFYPNASYEISSTWIVVFFALYSWGELLVSALGVAMVTHIAPKRLYGIMMGIWFFAQALGTTLSGSLASLASVPKSLQSMPSATLNIYSGAFLKMGLIGLAGAVVGFALAPWLKKIAQIS